MSTHSFFDLASFIQHVSEVHPCCWMLSTAFSLYWWVVFHCTNKLQLFIHYPVEYLGCFEVKTIMNKAVMIIQVKSLGEYYVFIFLDITPHRKLPNFSSFYIILHPHFNMYKSKCSTISPKFSIVSVFDFSPLGVWINQGDTAEVYTFNAFLKIEI